MLDDFLLSTDGIESDAIRRQTRGGESIDPKEGLRTVCTYNSSRLDRATGMLGGLRIHHSPPENHKFYSYFFLLLLKGVGVWFPRE
jgi:hypothetical protein